MVHFWNVKEYNPSKVRIRVSTQALEKYIYAYMFIEVWLIAKLFKARNYFKILSFFMWEDRNDLLIQVQLVKK